MRGYVYVLSNKAMPNLLKIGYTTRTIRERIQELTTTGVPGYFEEEFYCEVDNAPYLEKYVHAKLASKRYSKEFFKCDLTLAIRVVKESILDCSIGLRSSGGRSSSSFLTANEQREIQDRENKRKAKEIAEANEKKIRDQKVSLLIDNFMSTAPRIEIIIKENKSKYGTARTAASGLLTLTGIGMLLEGLVDLPPYKDGENIALKLNNADRQLIISFKSIVNELTSLSAFDEACKKYLNKYRDTSSNVVDRAQSWETNVFKVSGYVAGMFSKL